MTAIPAAHRLPLNRPLRRPAGQRPQNRPRMGHQGEPTALLVLPAPRLGRQAFRPLVLLGHPFPAATDHRRSKDPQTSRSRTAVLLRASDHQRRRRRHQLPHPSHPRLCPRLPQSRTLQDRNLLPPRRITALPGRTMTHKLPGSAGKSGVRPVLHRDFGVDSALVRNGVGSVGAADDDQFGAQGAQAVDLQN